MRLALYDFDERLRSQVFQVVSIIELALRTLLGHELGRIDPHVHLKPGLLGSPARAPKSEKNPSVDYTDWLDRHSKELKASREDFVARAELTPPQLESWIRSLNIVRNYSAHHARMFNRVYTFQPRLPKPGRNSDLDAVRSTMNRCFGQLTLIQHLIVTLGLRGRNVLPEVVASYPTTVKPVPISHIGAPPNWQQLRLWNTRTN